MQYTHLALEERFLIHKLLQDDCSLRKIGCKLGHSHSTVIREVKCNSGRRGYGYKQANKFAKSRRSEASSVPRKMTEEICAMVKDLLVHGRWSPGQIAGRLRLEGVVYR